jgi:hypothetical protein
MNTYPEKSKQPTATAVIVLSQKLSSQAALGKKGGA